MKNIRRIAEDLFKTKLKQSGNSYDGAGWDYVHEWSGGILRHQKAILEQIEREKRAALEPTAHRSLGVNQSKATSTISVGSRGEPDI